MIRYRLTHETGYSYPAPVDVSHSLLRLRLRTAPGQTVLSQTLEIDPPPQSTRAYGDFFGNPTDYVLIDQPHRELTIRAIAEVSVAPLAAPAEDRSTPWDEIEAALAGRGDGEAQLAWFMLPPSASTVATPAMVEWARPAFPRGRPVFQAARALMAAIHKGFRYSSGATDVTTPVAEAFAARHGVCQDFAQVALAILRALGIPCRYVSGYIRTYPPPGQPRLVGADASHAWFGVWCPRLGWLDLDPTNNIALGPDHVTLAWGRDYQDIAPVSGVILGGGLASLRVSVDLAPLDTGAPETMPISPATGAPAAGSADAGTGPVQTAPTAGA